MQDRTTSRNTVEPDPLIMGVQTSSPIVWKLLSIAALLIVFVTDLYSSRGFSHGSLYMLVVLLAARSDSPRFVIGISLLSVLLTIAGVFLSPPMQPELEWYYAWWNRLFAIFGLAVSCALVLAYISRQKTMQDKERLQRQLQQKHDLLRVASAAGHLGGWSVELPGYQVTWSDEVARIHDREPGYSPTVEEGLNYYPREYQDRIRVLLDECANRGTPFDEVMQIVTARGRRVWVRAIGEVVRADDGKIIRLHGAFQDITAARSAQEREQALAERLTLTLESMSDAFLMLDRDWRFSFLNAQAERLLLRRRNELLGQPIWVQFPEAVGSTFQQQYEYAVLHVQTVHFREFYPPLNKWFDVSAYPSERGLAIYFRDISAQVLLEQQVQQSQRLESVGQLTGGIAHDFNNLLTVILGNAELLAEQLEDHPKLHKLAETVSGAAQRGADLTQRLLAFARRQALAPQAVDVNALVGGMEDLLRRTLGEHIEIGFRAGKEVWPAQVDPVQLESALLNLCLNARDAMPGGGKLTLETSNVALDEEYVQAHAELSAGEYVLLAVTDTGCGIAPEHMSRVFEPFFTTKEPGKGTGLGLPMVYGFIKQTGGHISIYSEPGHGTVVKLYLPRHGGGGAALTESKEPEGELAGGGERILLVEDERMVREYAAGQLRMLGYEVLEAGNGVEALEVVKAEGGRIDLLFTDVVMPGGVSGKELAEQVQRLRPGVKVLYTSGYTGNTIVHHGRLDEGVNLLSKPYRRRELVEMIRKVLGQEDDNGR